MALGNLGAGIGIGIAIGLAFALAFGAAKKPSTDGDSVPTQNPTAEDPREGNSPDGAQR